MPELTRLDDIRRRRPLLHCISNIVTANDCANIALALGASPMMAEAPEEMADIARIADAEVLNCGTPSRAKFDACLISGREGSRQGKPGRRAAAITGGSPLTPLVTGTGCMLSVLCGAFAAVEPNAFDAALMASVFWKACSERAEHVSGGAGPGSLRAALMDSARALVPGSPCFDGRVQAL